MNKARILISLGILAFVGIRLPIALADVITPEMEDLKRREASLQKAIISSRALGTFQQQLAAAGALDKLCARSYDPYGVNSLIAKRWLADVYWRNGQPARAKEVLASFYSGFDKAYKDGIRKIQASEAHKSDVVMDFSNGNDPYFGMTFYKSGPGGIHLELQLNLLTCLSDICKAAGQTQEASTYLSLAGQTHKKIGANGDYGRKQPWADAVSDARLAEHPFWSNLRESYNEISNQDNAKRVAQLKLMLDEAKKFGNDNLCVGYSLWEMGQCYEGAQAEPLLRRATEIYWTNGSPYATDVSRAYMRCMEAQHREQDGKKFLDGLKAGSSPAKKQANATTTTARR